jgi:Ca-activated chloride channel family protein
MLSSHANPDSWLDAELRNVALPPGLLERLRQVAAPSDEELDAALRDVPVPAGLSVRLRRIARGRLRLGHLAQMAVAASLILGIGLSYVGAVIGLVTMASRGPELRRTGPALQVSVTLSSETATTPVDLEKLAVAFTQGRKRATVPVALTPEVAAPVVPVALNSPLAEMVDRFGAPYRKARLELVMDRHVAAWPDPEVLLASSSADLPELRKAPGLIRQGVKLPPVPGLDLVILHRIHPFLSPAAFPELRVSHVPLDIDASSFELTRRYLDDRELPPPDVLRTEEFLAAVDYQLPKPTHRVLGLHMAGGASPFRGPSLHVLQVGVQARDLPALPHQPTRLILAVDVSASMQWGGRLEMARQAIRRLIQGMGPEDRVSLLAFSEEAQVLADNRGPGEADLLEKAVTGLQPGSSTNLAAGLRRAYGLAQELVRSGQWPVQVVVFSDGLARLDDPTIERIERCLTEAAGRGVTLHVVDLAQDPGTADADPLLSRFTRAGDGSIHRSSSADEVHWALVEVTTGQSQLVASNVSLRVRFNPKSVAAYRLVGHEAVLLAGLKPAPLEADFHAGQSATAMYEIVLRKNSDPEVAVAELAWTDPASRRREGLSQAFRRGQLAKTLLDAPLPVQAGAVVAEAAETLRATPEVLLLPNGFSVVRPRRGAWSLTRVLQVAGQLDTRLEENASFMQFLSVIEQATEARPSRSGGTR